MSVDRTLAVTDLPGIGDGVAESLAEHGYDSVSKIVNGDVCALLDVDGVGKARLTRIKHVLENRHGVDDVFVNTVFLRDEITDDAVALECETRVVWEEDPREYEFVREKMKESKQRQAPHSWKKNNDGITIVGYGIAHEKMPSSDRSNYLRRVFYLKEHDKTPGGNPIEAVVPETIGVRKHGQSPRKVNDRSNHSLTGTIE